VRFVSYEPAIGAVRLDAGPTQPDWIITGGESGAHFRPTLPQWIRAIRDQCAAAGVAFHFKQWPGFRAGSNGCLLDGVEHKEFPPILKQKEPADAG
jgi:protein gp37